MKNKLTLFLAGGFLLSIMVYTIYAYNKPQDPCIEELVNVICTKVDSGQFQTDPLGGFEISYGRMDSVKFYPYKRGTKTEYLSYNDIMVDKGYAIEYHTESGSILQNSVGQDSFIVKGVLSRNYRYGKLEGFSSSLESIPFNWRNTHKIWKHVNVYRDKRDAEVEAFREKETQENIKKACDLATQIKRNF
jgi:hypothetical protein